MSNQKLNREFLTEQQWDKVVVVRRQQHLAMIKDLLDDVLDDINDHGIVANTALMAEIKQELEA